MNGVETRLKELIREVAVEWQRKMATLNRELSRKQNGSNTRKRATYRLAKAHDAMANQRRAWFFKLVHALCDADAVMGFEDLNRKAMQRLWGKQGSDRAFGEFLSLLQYVADKRGCTIIQMERCEPTTPTCSACGMRHQWALHERICCCECGLELDRDPNAALNMLRVGASTHDLGGVRREPATADPRSPA